MPRYSAGRLGSKAGVHNFYDQPAIAPKVKVSTFYRTSTHKTTFNAGDLVPVYVDEVLPGDTFKINDAYVIRQSTLIAPVMDDSFVDMYYFFVPSRILYDHWEEFMGANKTKAWASKVEYGIPHISFNKAYSIDDLSKSVADYMGIPPEYLSAVSQGATTDKPIASEVSALPFRGYQKIYEDWFRNENTQDPDNIHTDEKDDDISEFELKKVNKYKDYFTSALPDAQAGSPITVNLGGRLPIKETMDLTSGFNLFNTTNGDSEEGITSVGIDHKMSYKGFDVAGQINGYVSGATITETPTSFGWAMTGKYHDKPNDVVVLTPESYADASEATGISINDLRMAFAMQKMLEKDARGGRRYVEIIETHFGVRSNDARLQRAEYLGGHHKSLNIQQVLQTSASTNQSPLAETAAYGLTTNVSHQVEKSFTEHGYVIGLMCVRTSHTYQQGIERFWTRKTRNDFYDPTFANIGEQPIINREIYAADIKVDDKGVKTSTLPKDLDEAFGFQEAWADYRYKPSRVSGEFRSSYKTPLDIWHYADKYAEMPRLSADWVKETSVNVDRTLAVQSSVSSQYIADILIQNKATRPMPAYSIPGMIDMD